MYGPVSGNDLPFDSVTGGLARMVGWLNVDGSPYADNGDGTLTIPLNGAVTSARIVSGVAVSKMTVIPGSRFTFGVTASGLVAVSMTWIYTDGTVSTPGYGVGNPRASVTATVPPNVKAVVLGINSLTATVVTAGTGVKTVSYAKVAAVPPDSFIAATTAPGPVVVSAASLAISPTDIGPATPVLLDATFGQRVWASLPQLYRDADRADTRPGMPLSKFLHGLFSPVDAVEAIRDQILAGQLTDPTLVLDAWVPWLAQMLGVIPAATPTATRALMTARQLAPIPGTRAAIAAVARQFLTGTQIVDVFPNAANRWLINVRIRADEIAGFMGSAAFTAAMLATGQVPAGFSLNVVVGLPTWGQVDAQAAGHWSGLDRLNNGSPRWSDIDSIGVTGLGSPVLSGRAASVSLTTGHF